ncbi:hypothetical protein SteCoe_28209 [Stentor coeruleus]|uniref:Uncharacterized protein n=1 Tax=Stentor coeruleus TaxID=5963 RepID=A0A1R2B8Q8_9CILI|nr:hypothetical protein SteCoe_28209 [Stentor coeruleus]
MKLYQVEISQNSMLDLNAFIAIENSFKKFYKTSSIQQVTLYNYINSNILKKYIEYFDNHNKSIEKLWELSISNILCIYERILNENNSCIKIVKISEESLRKLETSSDLVLLNLITVNYQTKLIVFLLSENYPIVSLHAFPTSFCVYNKKFSLSGIILTKGSVNISLRPKNSVWKVKNPIQLSNKLETFDDALKRNIKSGFIPTAYFYMITSLENQDERPSFLNLERLSSCNQKYDDQNYLKTKCHSQMVIKEKILKAMENDESLNAYKKRTPVKTINERNAYIAENIKEKNFRKSEGAAQAMIKAKAQGPPKLVLKNVSQQGPRQLSIIKPSVTSTNILETKSNDKKIQIEEEKTSASTRYLN